MLQIIFQMIQEILHSLSFLAMYFCFVCFLDFPFVFVGFESYDFQDFMQCLVIPPFLYIPQSFNTHPVSSIYTFLKDWERGVW